MNVVDLGFELNWHPPTDYGDEERGGRRASGPRCDARFSEFIDHVVLDARAARDLAGFEEVTFTGGDRLSDCPSSGQ